jgi:hypothetical protein
MSIEQLLANLKGDEKVDPRQVEVLERLHDRINRISNRTVGQTRVGGFNDG